MHSSILLLQMNNEDGYQSIERHWVLSILHNYIVHVYRRVREDNALMRWRLRSRTCHRYSPKVQSLKVELHFHNACGFNARPQYVLLHGAVRRSGQPRETVQKTGDIDIVRVRRDSDNEKQQHAGWNKKRRQPPSKEAQSSTYTVHTRRATSTVDISLTWN
jgi:hypothetical protein